jgi:hypothetical protein
MKIAWKRTIRTVVQIVVPLAVTLPEIVAASGVNDALPWVAGAVGGAAALTRIMAVPQVQKWLLWLNTEDEENVGR